MKVTLNNLFKKLMEDVIQPTVDAVAPVAEVMTPVVEAVAHVFTREDELAANACPNCDGSGLSGETDKCGNCHGTGKV